MIFTEPKKLKAKINNKFIGAFGERLAQNYLIHSGYEIVFTNWRCAFGEIDIVAKKHNRLYFFEVKTRTKIVSGDPREGVDCAKKKKIEYLIEEYLKDNDVCDIEYEVKSIGIICSKTTIETFSLIPAHIQNTFLTRLLKTISLQVESIY